MSVFTEYVRSLGAGGEPGEREVARLWRALKGALRSELERRGLWARPPSYLGLVGWTSWGGGPGEEPPADAPRETALDELAVDCYGFVFVDRLRSLEAQLKLKPDIEGLIRLDVRHFVHERQRRHDPLGFRLFDVLRAAVRGALDAGELHLLGGDPRLRNGTALGFSPHAELPPAPRSDHLRALATRWNDEILLCLFTTQGKKQVDVAAKLRRRLPELRAEGIEAFLFRTVLDPLKHDARMRWAAFLRQSAGDVVWGEGLDEAGGAVRIARPDTAAEEDDSLDRLVREVAAALGPLETDAETRGQLASLWGYLGRWASRPDDPAGSLADPRRGGGGGPAPIADEPDFPSRRKIASQLGIPIERLPELFEILARLVVEYEAAELRRSRRRCPGR